MLANFDAERLGGAHGVFVFECSWSIESAIEIQMCHASCADDFRKRCRRLATNDQQGGAVLLQGICEGGQALMEPPPAGAARSESRQDSV